MIVDTSSRFLSSGITASLWTVPVQISESINHTFHKLGKPPRRLVPDNARELHSRSMHGSYALFGVSILPSTPPYLKSPSTNAYSAKYSMLQSLPFPTQYCLILNGTQPYTMHVQIQIRKQFRPSFTQNHYPTQTPAYVPFLRNCSSNSHHNSTAIATRNTINTAIPLIIFNE